MKEVKGNTFVHGRAKLTNNHPKTVSFFLQEIGGAGLQTARGLNPILPV